MLIEYMFAFRSCNKSDVWMCLCLAGPVPMEAVFGKLYDCKATDDDGCVTLRSVQNNTGGPSQLQILTSEVPSVVSPVAFERQPPICHP